ncbi:hypothetical protein [Desulfarculus baarsii]
MSQHKQPEAMCAETICPVWDACARGRMPGDTRYQAWITPFAVGPAGCPLYIHDPRLDDCPDGACRLGD